MGGTGGEEWAGHEKWVGQEGKNGRARIRMGGT